MNREDFPILKSNPNLIYFDNGATTLKPKCMIERTKEYYELYSANAHRGDYGISLKVDMAFEGVRESTAKFINAETNEILFTSGSTESLNLVAFGYFKNRLNSNDGELICSNHLKINNTNLEPEVVADQVIEHFKLGKSHSHTI